MSSFHDTEADSRRFNGFHLLHHITLKFQAQIPRGFKLLFNSNVVLHYMPYRPGILLLLFTPHPSTTLPLMEHCSLMFHSSYQITYIIICTFINGMRTICCKCPRSDLVISFLWQLFFLPTADPYAEAAPEAVSTLCIWFVKTVYIHGNKDKNRSSFVRQIGVI